MLSLGSARWSELRQAYGDASNIPALLRQLENLPTSDGQAEPWFSLWSSLAHQGDVHSASFAAVPHVVSCLSTDPRRADFSFLQLPAWIEICRQKKSVLIPDDLAPAYWAALARLPHLVSEAADREWDDDFLSCALAAVAVAKGNVHVAEAVLELNSDVAREFLRWHLDL